MADWGLVLDWGWQKPKEEGLCVHCHKKTDLKNQAGRFSHKVCEERRIMGEDMPETVKQFWREVGA